MMHEPTEPAVEVAEAPGKRPGEAAAFLVTIVLLVAIALLGVAFWKTIDEDFQPVAEGEPAEGAAPAAGENPILVTVNGTEIRQAEFQAAVASLPEQMQAPLATPAGRKALAEELVRMKLLETYARQNGLDRQPPVAAQLAITQGNILANAALRHLLSSQEEVSPRELYERNLDQFETVHLSQIVVPYQGSVVAGEGEAPSEAEARRQAAALAERARQGADFAALARAESADRESAERGGDIGNIGHGTFPEEVDELIFSLPEGAVSEPIKTLYGIHIFKVLDKETRTFEDVEDALVRSGRQLQVQETVEALREKATVEFNPEYFPNEVGSQEPGVGSQ